MVSREPVHLPHLELHVRHRQGADVVELQRLRMLGALVAHRADQPRTSLAGQREHREEVGLVEIDMQLAIDRRAFRLDVGDVEHLPIGPARKRRADRRTHHRAGAVAAGDVVSLAVFLLPVCIAQLGGDAAQSVAEADQLDLPLDRDPEGLQPLDQQLLMLVLREYLQERIGRHAFADGLERDPCLFLAPDPEVNRRRLVAACDNLVREVELTVELQRAGLDGQGARGGPGPVELVHDADAHAELGKPQRQYEPGRAGADDQHLTTGHGFSSLWMSSPFSAARAC